MNKLAKAPGKKQDSERRRSLRRPILETFSCFVVLPEHGFFKLTVHDLSENGIGFDLDAEGAPQFKSSAQVGDELELRFHINQSLFISLLIQIRRIDDSTGVRRVGAEFIRKNDPEFKAYLAFIELLDRILDSLQIDPTQAKNSR